MWKELRNAQGPENNFLCWGSSVYLPLGVLSWYGHGWVLLWSICAYTTGAAQGGPEAHSLWVQVSTQCSEMDLCGAGLTTELPVLVAGRVGSLERWYSVCCDLK